MAVGTILAALVKAVGPTVAPFILASLLGKGISARGNALATQSRSAVPDSIDVNPKYPGWYREILNPGARGNKKYGAWTRLPKTARVGGKLAALGRGATKFANAGAILGPMLLNTVGKGVGAAGVAGGALAGAVGKLPKHLADVGNSAGKRSIYGAGPADALGGISSDLGTAAGVGIGAAGSALGSSITDAATTLRSIEMQRRLYDLYHTMGVAMSPSQAHLQMEALHQIGQAGRGR